MSLATRVKELVARVEYRRADSQEEKDAIFQMRHVAYTREGHIEPRASGLFTDPDDENPNAWLIGMFIDGALASSIRLHVASRPGQFLPASRVFSDIIGPRLAAGDVIVDVSRMTSRLEFARVYPFMTFVTMRSAFLAEEHFGADYITAAMRPEYQAIYRRMGEAVKWAEPRPYPPLVSKQTLMAYECRRMERPMREAYPFLRSTPAERRALFGRSSNSEQDPYAELTAGRRARRLASMQHSTTWVA